LCVLRVCRDAKVIERYTAFMTEEVLLPRDTLATAALGYHLADLWIPELLSAAAGESVPAAALAALLEPFCQFLARTQQVAGIPRVLCVPPPGIAFSS
jgi:ribosomal RNA-processing protein 1